MKWRIMIVDDEEDIRLVLRAALSEEFEIVEAHDGLDALEKLERYEPDFICMDVMMPLMDGFQACEAIRKSPRFSDVPIMFLTALGGKDDIKTGYGKGANLYLTKPFEPERLIKNIKVHFGGSADSARPKRYTIEQLESLESKGAEPEAPGSGEFVLPDFSGDGTEKEKLVDNVPIKPLPPPIPDEVLPRVMVVDDDPDIVAVMEAILTDVAEVVSAGDGMQAIERLVRYQPDLLIIDIMLPKMSGFQLCQSLRSNRGLAKMPILICSAKCSDRDVQFALRAGANDFLAKPFDAVQLLKKLDRLTQLPGFRIRANKALSIQEIHLAETPDPTDVFESAESEQLRERVQRLADQANEKADNPRPPGEIKKEKRRFFGFLKK